MNMFQQVKSICSGVKKHPLTRGDVVYKKQVIKRILKWQVEKNKASNGKVVPWINGRKLLIYPGRTSAVGNYYYGLLEYEPMSFLFHYLRQDDVFYDIGANMGVYSVLASECRKVVAFEPAEDTYKLLNEQLKLNSMGNAITEMKGVSAQCGTVSFSKGKDATNHILKENSDKEKEFVSINTISLDMYVSDDFFPTVCKIDAEGAENDIIKGGRQTLQDKRMNVIIMEIFGDKFLSDSIKECGFELYLYDPKERKLRPGSEKDAGNNGIYIRDVNKAINRISKGKAVVYCGKQL